MLCNPSSSLRSTSRSAWANELQVGNAIPVKHSHLASAHLDFESLTVVVERSCVHVRPWRGR